MKKNVLRIRELLSQIIIIKFFVKSPYSGLNKLDKKIEEYLNYDDGFFVELGANDGVTQSNTLYLEKHRKWKGVLVEPTPHNFLKCLENRSKLKKSWEYATETIKSGRGIKKGRWPLMKVKLISLMMKPEEARLIQIALGSLDEGIGEESDDCDSFCSDSADIFGYI